MSGAAVSLVSAGNGRGGPGDTLAAGTFDVTNTGTTTIKVNSVTINLSNASLFSQAQLNGSSMALSGNTVTFRFPAPVPVSPHGRARFQLSVVVAGSASGASRKAISAALIAAPYLSGGDGSGGGGGGLLPLFAGLMLLGLSLRLSDARRARRIGLMAGFVLLAAVGLTACGGGCPTCTNNAVPVAQTSTQTVQALDVTSGEDTIAVQGLPIELGVVTVTH